MIVIVAGMACVLVVPVDLPVIEAPAVAIAIVVITRMVRVLVVPIHMPVVKATAVVVVAGMA